ncbi:hypothetical protein [Streptomyces bacillaris]|uniref:hypothetical protein n=1 Tax=Streptomyces bacillaris TaxID=68179 RepID=UPI0034603F07
MKNWIGRALGAAAHTTGATARVVPGIGGAVLVSYGMWLAWAPLGVTAAGVFLLLLDRRMP